MNTPDKSTLLLFSLVLGMSAIGQAADNERICPVTKPNHQIAGVTFPEFSWYGSDAFAVTVPLDGTWVTTAPNALIAVKLFWWTPGFRPGSEDKLKLTIHNLFDPDETIDVGRATNAGRRESDSWTILFGIDIR
ncbi:MAG: hypothetical protein ACE5F8_01610, partial [Woeseiaceae bacterium]